MAKHLWIAPALVLVACGGRPSSSANHPTTIEAPDPVAGGADLPPGDEAAERPGPDDDATIAAQLMAVPDAIDESWQRSVTMILLKNFDRDESGAIDTDPEIVAVSCDVLRALDAAARTWTDHSVAVIYGFASKYYLGHQLGFAQEVQSRLFTQSEDCGLEME